MKKNIENENPYGFEADNVNDPIYLLARHKAYCDIVDNDDEIKHYKKIEGLGEEQK